MKLLVISLLAAILLPHYNNYCQDPQGNAITQPPLLSCPEPNSDVDGYCVEACFIIYKAGLIDLRERACTLFNSYDERYHGKIETALLTCKACVAAASTPEAKEQCRYDAFDEIEAARKEFEDKCAILEGYYDVEVSKLVGQFQQCALACCIPPE